MLQFEIFNLLGKGYNELNDPINLVNYFVWEKVVKTETGKNAPLSFFLAGHFCIVRGFYCSSMNFYSFDQSPFITGRSNNFKGGEFTIRFSELYYVKASQAMERFTFVRRAPYSFVVSDERATPYDCQRWVHSFRLEIFWAAFPAFIVILIIIPSLVLLYSSEAIKYCEGGVRATGNQWFWNYAESGLAGVGMIDSFYFEPKETSRTVCFKSLVNSRSWETPSIDCFYKSEGDSYLLGDNDLSEGLKRLVDTDKHAIIPSFSALRVAISATDVLHALALPPVGAKIDAVPGRLNSFSTWALRSGFFLGQCSELCGAGHASMPITVEMVFPEGMISHVAGSEKNVPFKSFLKEQLALDSHASVLYFSAPKKDFEELTAFRGAMPICSDDQVSELLFRNLHPTTKVYITPSCRNAFNLHFHEELSEVDQDSLFGMIVAHSKLCDVMDDQVAFLKQFQESEIYKQHATLSTLVVQTEAFLNNISGPEVSDSFVPSVDSWKEYLSFQQNQLSLLEKHPQFLQAKEIERIYSDNCEKSFDMTKQILLMCDNIDKTYWLVKVK